MNRYHDAMEHCAPPPELEARLREAVLSAEPGTPGPSRRLPSPGLFPEGGFWRRC